MKISRKNTSTTNITMNFNQKMIRFLFTFLLICVGGQINLSAQERLDTTFNAGVSNAPASVYISAIQPNGKILVGGSFQLVNGNQRSSLARLNSDGTIDTSFNNNGSGPNGSIFEIIILPDGKILIGGGFSNYNGIAISGLARLNSDGSLDTSFNPGGTGVIGIVRSIILQANGKILFAGDGVTSYNGIPRNSIARINADGTIDASFIPESNNGRIEVIEAQVDGKILIGGSFTNYGGIPRRSVARINSDGTLDTSFVPAATDQAGVTGIAIQSDGKILLGGYFDTGGNVNLVARLNTDGSVDATFTPPILEGYAVEYFAIQPDGKILIAGGYDTAISSQKLVLLRLNANGTIDNSFQSNTADIVGYSVKLQTDGKIILTGDLTRYGSQNRNGIVRLNSDGSIDNSFDSSLTGYGLTNAIAQQPDGKILVGGTFQTANGNFSKNLVRFNLDGTLDTSFNVGTGIGNLQYARITERIITVQTDGKILVGGRFGTFNGIPRIGIVRLNTNGSVDTSFNATGLENSFPDIYDIFVQSDSKILIGGQFTLFPSFQRNLVRLNSDGSFDSTFNSGNQGPTSPVFKIIRQSDGKFVIAGAFSNYNGTSRSRIARINADGTLDTSFDPGTGANNIIYDAAIQNDGKILVSGAFTTFNGTSRNRIARLNTDGSLDTSFNPGTGADNIVYSIALQTNGKIIVGGLFANYNGTAINRLAKLNTDGTLDTSLNSGFDNDSSFYVRKLLYQNDGKLLVGGVFNSYAGVPRNSLLRLTTTSLRPTLFDFDGDGKADISVYRPNGGNWYLLQSQSGFTGAQFGVATDKLVPADYDGDGKTDLAVYRNGTWYLLRSQLGFTGISFGDVNDIPQPADFDGDGKAELAVWRPSNGTWYVYNLVNNQFTFAQFGASTDKPVVGDYDGDGKANFAVFRPSAGFWYIARSNGIASQNFDSVQFGDSNDKPVPADYDGDGKTDVAVFRPSNGTWYLLRSQLGFTGMQFGISTDLPTPADYDGDGKADVAVFRSGVWYLNRSTAGFTGVQFGAGSDKPVPNAFVP